MAKLKNYTSGPKGVHTVGGLVYIDAGRTSDDLDISEGELKAAKATGWFTRPKADDAEPDAEPAPAPTTKPEPKA